MKKTATLCILLIASLSVYCQQTFTKNYMPVTGDTIFYHSLISTEDYSATGANYIWDFSTLTGATWAADTFVAVLSTPLTYNAVFNNILFYPKYVATVASPQADQTIPPSTSITNVYNYYKLTDTAFAQVGMAANVGGAPLPVKYDNIDYMYKFPSTMGSVDSCYSSGNISISTLGSYLKKQNRFNEYDGWGTLYTPMDTLEVFRIKTTLIGHDTIVYNGMSIPLNSNTVEYKWFSPGHRNPVFVVSVVQSQFANVTTVKYLDKPQLHVGIPEVSSASFNIVPNPFVNQLTITANAGEKIEKVRLFNITGAEIALDILSSDKNTRILNTENLSNSPYIIEITSNKGVERKVVIKK
jgi:hypothetical protein